jgi:eukaryotic-like serine/threonine-protein kinase
MPESRAQSEDEHRHDVSATHVDEARPRAEPGLELPRGHEVGRYVVLSRLGAGAMGVVVAAYDPELDRKVALKLLHPREGRRSDMGHRRLLAEAQALARLSDPNVVAVHDVGIHEGRVFVAMEFVEGQTLTAWLAAAPRPWPQVLEERRMEFEALVAELGRGDVRIVDTVVAMAVALDDVEPCRDAQALARLPTPPHDEREAVRGVQAELSKTAVLVHAGAYDEARTTARAATTAAEALGWPPLVALAHFREGQTLQWKGAYADAEALLEQAHFEAMRADAIELAAVVAGRLAFLVGYHLARRDEGLRWAKYEAVLLSRFADPAGIYEIQHLSGLSAIYYAAGAFDDVEEVQRRILPIQERLLGPEHPDVANSLNNLANVYYRRGDHHQARALYTRALAIEERTLGPEHPVIADQLDNIGLICAAQDEYAEALALHERALVVRERTMGPGHPTTATTLNNLAVVHESLGAYDEAIALHERARGIWQAALGPDHPDVALSLNNLGSVYRAAGQLDRAGVLYERALATWERTVGPEHPDLAMPLQGLAMIALAQGRAAEAVPLAERALRLREVAAVDPDLIEGIRFVLVRALWDSGQDRTRAVSSARRALQAQRDRGEAGAAGAAEVEQWLATHAP